MTNMGWFSTDMLNHKEKRVKDDVYFVFYSFSIYSKDYDVLM